jgi:hypothetical protein
MPLSPDAVFMTASPLPAFKNTGRKTRAATKDGWPDDLLSNSIIGAQVLLSITEFSPSMGIN